MGQSQSISADVEIAAPPATVRSVFSDFSRFNQWSQWTFEPVDAGKSMSDLKAGDRVDVNLKSMKFQPVVMANSPDTLEWEGSLYGVFIGKHRFTISPSKTQSGGTTFTQTEDFRGLLAFLMGPGWSGREKTLANWREFNADLKKEAEKAA